MWDFAPATKDTFTYIYFYVSLTGRSNIKTLLLLLIAGILCIFSTGSTADIASLRQYNDPESCVASISCSTCQPKTHTKTATTWKLISYVNVCPVLLITPNRVNADTPRTPTSPCYCWCLLWHLAVLQRPAGRLVLVSPVPPAMTEVTECSIQWMLCIYLFAWCSKNNTHIFCRQCSSSAWWAAICS